MKFIFDSGKASKSGRTNPESVAGFNRNTRQLSTGIGGRFAPDFPLYGYSQQKNEGFI
ncbi:MAG: hypothetical protein HOA72_23200 [Desulfobacula sp.]|uniref:hypothetical protein n=1 Tax=Desulfobacula sp. TaxID=2593537 RepID=UPI002A094ED4|nr:hypothetical protein [Desulfobacteraceae bacterium]MBT6751826.1 hypothetical protein [Desulfobacula sp.]